MDCHICNKPLRGRYCFDSWGHKMCESHLNNDAVFCASCTGFTKKDIILSDGRVLCKVCESIAVKPNDPVDLIKRTVINNLIKVGFSDLRLEDIDSIQVVSVEKLAELRKKPIDPNNKGMTFSRVSSSFGLLSGKKQEMTHTIYMLSYLTKIQFAGTLAHEMLHAWQIQNGVKMSPKLTEGLCNMGAYLMYDSLGSSLTKIYLKQLHESPDLIYGDGFREVYAHYERLGWADLIKYVRENKLVDGY